MNKKSQIQFVQRCAALLEVGISLSETLSIIMRMEKSSVAIVEKIRNGVEKGISLSKSMMMTNVKFDPTLISMISHGESSGILALSMRQAGEILEKKDELLKKMVGVLIYPTVIALATIGMTLFLVMYIFPKILPLLSSMNVKLPLLTRIIRKIYELLSSYGMGMVFIIVIIIFIFSYFYQKRIKFKSKVQMSLLIIPMAGTVLKKYLVCSYCKSAGMLLESGQTLPAVLVQCAAAISFEPYRRALEISKSEVLRGVPLSVCMRSFEAIFPSEVSDMLSIGERSGTLSSMFHHINRIYEQDIDYLIKHLSSVIEPVLMIAMGLLVGSVALSIILPIYEITSHLNR